MAEMTAEDWIAKADAVCDRWEAERVKFIRHDGVWLATWEMRGRGRLHRRSNSVVAEGWPHTPTLTELAETVASALEAHETYLRRLIASETLDDLANTDPLGWDSADAWISDIRDTAADLAGELRVWCDVYVAEHTRSDVTVTPDSPDDVYGTQVGTIVDTDTYEPTINGAP